MVPKTDRGVPSSGIHYKAFNSCDLVIQKNVLNGFGDIRCKERPIQNVEVALHLEISRLYIECSSNCVLACCRTAEHCNECIGDRDIIYPGLIIVESVIVEVSSYNEILSRARQGPFIIWIGKESSIPTPPHRRFQVKPLRGVVAEPNEDELSRW